MPKLVANGALMTCNQGLAPATLTVLPRAPEADTGTVATVNDNAFPTNIPGFQMCQSMANPAVQAATAAAQGVLTPAPCVPQIVGPWVPGLLYGTTDGVALLTEDSTCQCAYAGVIQIDMGNCFVEAD